MGTRADFYIRDTKNKLEYLGSIGWDGYPDGIDFGVLWSETAKEFRSKVESFLSKREDGSIPSRDGWPWPWDNSNTTDYAYIFSKDDVLCSNYGSALFDPVKHRDLSSKIGSLNDILRMKISDSIKTEIETLLTDLEKQLEELPKDGRKIKFPNMTKLQKVSYGKNSGLIVIGG